MNPIVIDAVVASITTAPGVDPATAAECLVMFGLDLDPDMTHHGDWSDAAHPAFAFAVAVRAGLADTLTVGDAVTVTIEAA